LVWSRHFAEERHVTITTPPTYIPLITPNTLHTLYRSPPLEGHISLADKNTTRRHYDIHCHTNSLRRLPPKPSTAIRRRFAASRRHYYAITPFHWDAASDAATRPRGTPLTYTRFGLKYQRPRHKQYV